VQKVAGSVNVRVVARLFAVLVVLTALNAGMSAVIIVNLMVHGATQSVRVVEMVMKKTKMRMEMTIASVTIVSIIDSWLVSREQYIKCSVQEGEEGLTICHKT
jgi:hypothetical protein